MMCLAIPLPVRYMYHIIQLNRVLRKPPNDVAANLDVRPHPTSIHDKVYKQIHVPRMPTTMRALLLYTCIRTDHINYIVCPVVAYDSNNHAAPPRGTSNRDFMLPREKVKSQKTAVLKKIHDSSTCCRRVAIPRWNAMKVGFLTKAYEGGDFGNPPRSILVGWNEPSKIYRTTCSAREKNGSNKPSESRLLRKSKDK